MNYEYNGIYRERTPNPKYIYAFNDGEELIDEYIYIKYGLEKTMIKKQHISTEKIIYLDILGHEYNYDYEFIKINNDIWLFNGYHGFFKLQKN